MVTHTSPSVIGSENRDPDPGKSSHTDETSLHFRDSKRESYISNLFHKNSHQKILHGKQEGGKCWQEVATLPEEYLK